MTEVVEHTLSKEGYVLPPEALEDEPESQLVDSGWNQQPKEIILIDDDDDETQMQDAQNQQRRDETRTGIYTARCDNADNSNDAVVISRTGEEDDNNNSDDEGERSIRSQVPHCEERAYLLPLLTPQYPSASVDELSGTPQQHRFRDETYRRMRQAQLAFISSETVHPGRSADSQDETRRGENRNLHRHMRRCRQSNDAAVISRTGEEGDNNSDDEGERSTSSQVPHCKEPGVCLQDYRRSSNAGIETDSPGGGRKETFRARAGRDQATVTPRSSKITPRLFKATTSPSIPLLISPRAPRVHLQRLESQRAPRVHRLRLHREVHLAFQRPRHWKSSLIR
ncbi:hypothetical protein K440DRAFT_641480 [Wilcoxina mikolae CBS 423.85]|nr:hypothetical protein K440DRAFT_641480 [Wilcoxina mikolae CBS 423.85]